jgi:hypothetical protein
MRYIVIIILLAGFLQQNAYSQYCLPDGITFTNQAQIDSFQVNYPGCTEIEGNVGLIGWDIISLSGLSMLQKLNGNVYISGCDQLKNLVGLDNVTSIGGNLLLYPCDSLTSLSGLENLSSIGGDLEIGGFGWSPNHITSLEALENLSMIGGSLNIHNCNSLVSLSGLENIDPQSMDELWINNNSNLSSCEAHSICDYLANPAGSVNVYNNATGCNNPAEIASSCGIQLDCLPYGNYYFLSQDDVDNFITNFPGCTNLQGSLKVNSTDITNLDGFNTIVSIGGSLSLGITMGGNESLKDITGLSNLTNIGGNLLIEGNDSLTNLTGLNNLSAIGGSLSILINYSLNSLAAFSGLNSIGSALDIEENYSLGNIDGFSNLSSIGDDLRISGNIGLDSIIFQNLVDISGGIDISGNDSLSGVLGFAQISSLDGEFTIRDTWLQDLSGFSNLTLVGGNVSLNQNDSITDLTGLDNLTTIGRDLLIQDNLSLINLAGLTNLISIGGKLTIKGNEALVDLAALSNFSSMKGELKIDDNDVLNSLGGLENLTSDSITNIFITNNASLASCEANSLCEYLSSPNGTVNIYNNAPGCNNPPEIAASCNISLPCLPYGHYYFYHQTDIDNFHNDYPDCTKLAGNVSINTSDITSLSGLSQITGIEKGLSILNCHALVNLSGLGNLDSIGGNFLLFQNFALESTAGLVSLEYIGGSFTINNNIDLLQVLDLDQISYIGNKLDFDYNPSLFTISGFSLLDSIMGDFRFYQSAYMTNLDCFQNLSYIGGDLSISSNSRLNSLTNMDKLTRIGGDLYIWGNDSLTSLSGLDNIEPTSIVNLQIGYNESLSECDVESICAYLISPDGNVNITNNANGCNSDLQVLMECSVGLEENATFNENITIYPNPASGIISVTSKDGCAIEQVNIYNYIGQIVLCTQNSLETIDVSMLANGMYVIAIQIDGRIISKKLIINKSALHSKP